MNSMKRVPEGLPELIPFSRAVLKIGAALCTGYILIAAVMLPLLRQPEYCMRAGVVFSGAIEGGLGCLVSAVISALLCDVIYKRDVKGGE